MPGRIQTADRRRLKPPSHTAQLAQIRARLQELASPETAAVLQRFFKTGAGEYGEGDVFIGIKIPPLRKLAREFEHAPLLVAAALLKSKVHEERTLALMILVEQFTRADENVREKIHKFYLAHMRFVNNWDLVDGSAPYIVGPFLWKRDRKLLYALARSTSLWERRIAILATYFFIRQNEFADTLKISELLLGDDHDLIHKAIGWMLREIGKRDLEAEESFLRKHHQQMPRTSLRYAIERFPENKRKKYLLGQM
jgi:3-methyladenine DNA glycosylase AlkD